MVLHIYYHVHCWQPKQLLKTMHNDTDFGSLKASLTFIELLDSDSGGVSLQIIKIQSTGPLTTRQKQTTLMTKK